MQGLMVLGDSLRPALSAPAMAQNGIQPKCPKCASENIAFYFPADVVHCSACGADFSYEVLSDFGQFFKVVSPAPAGEPQPKEKG